MTRCSRGARPAGSRCATGASSALRSFESPSSKHLLGVASSTHPLDRNGLPTWPKLDDGRRMMWRWIGLALVALAFSVASWPALGHAQQSDASGVLTAVALTEADLPAGLRRDEGRSGLRTTEEGAPSYQATFVANGSGNLPIMGVVN